MAKQVKMRARARRPLPPIYELAAFSVFGFCVAHGLSRSLFYRLVRSGAGPRIAHYEVRPAHADLGGGRAALAASP
jgi:hypothetical protein